MSGDTIAAIATAPGRGGVAVVRVSGPDAFALAERLTNKKPLVGRIQFAAFRRPDDMRHATADNRPTSVLDEGLLLSFKAPHSYTGEDVVEFQCHGGTVTPRRVLEACFAAGARLARRGEFTERAFMNGKLALDQAEAVLDLIDAKTDRAANAALEDLVGAAPCATPLAASYTSSATSRATLRQLYDVALNVSSTLEHALDIDEGELPDDFYARVAADIADVRARLVSARTRARERALLRQGVLVVLAGPPNAGKSSLLNALAGTNRAIVSDVPGTTRDAVEVWLDLDGWPVRLVDTAGLRETSDAIEAEGVKRSEELMSKAAVVVYLGSADDLRQPTADTRAATIKVVSKCDLLDDSRPTCDPATAPLRVSAKTGAGLAALKRALVAKLEEQAADFSEDAGDAQVALCHETLALLTQLPEPLDLVLAGNVMQRVCAKLGAEIGATYSEDLLSRIFSRFCVGK